MTTGQLGISNQQESGFGLSPILAEDPIAKTLAAETPVIIWTANKRFYSSHRCYLVQRFLYVFNEHFVC